MRRLWRARAVAVCVVCGLLAPRADASTALPVCGSPVRPLSRLAGRVDGLVSTGDAIVALAGASSRDGNAVPFLPHDDLLVLAANGGARTQITLPPYTIPPGLVAAPDRRGILFVVVDTALLTLNTAKGRIVSRDTLNVQPLGWPAAVAAGAGERLYIAGQPSTGRAAVLEALTVTVGRGRPRVAWRAPLGLTHAGIWLGLAGRDLLAAYLPNADDVHGTLALFDARSGALRFEYPVPVSPAAIDAVHDRLYLDVAGTIRVLALREGIAIAAAPGTGPLAVVPGRQLVAYVRGSSVVLANAKTLAPRERITMPDVTALAASSNDETLLVGRAGGIAKVDLRGCGAG